MSCGVEEKRVVVGEVGRGGEWGEWGVFGVARVEGHGGVVLMRAFWLSLSRRIVRES